MKREIKTKACAEHPGFSVIDYSLTEMDKKVEEFLSDKTEESLYEFLVESKSKGMEIYDDWLENRAFLIRLSFKEGIPDSFIGEIFDMNKKMIAYRRKKCEVTKNTSGYFKYLYEEDNIGDKLTEILKGANRNHEE